MFKIIKQDEFHPQGKVIEMFYSIDSARQRLDRIAEAKEAIGFEVSEVDCDAIECSLRHMLVNYSIQE